MRDDLNQDEIAQLRKMLREMQAANPLENGSVDSGTLTIRSSSRGLVIEQGGQMLAYGRIEGGSDARLVWAGNASMGRLDVDDRLQVYGDSRFRGQVLIDDVVRMESELQVNGNVFIRDINEIPNASGRRMLVIAENGAVEAAPVPTGGGGDPPGGTTFMAPFPWSTVTSEYGPRDLPGTSPFHRGIDFGIYPAVEGATIVAAGSGVVSSVSLHSDAGPYGLEINHGPASDGKNIRTQYWHNNSRLVGLGATVEKGQPIATVGGLGNSTGPHLHWECHVDGAHMNPRDFIAQYGDG